MEEKSQLPYLQLDDAGEDPLPVEMVVNLVADEIGNISVLYGPNAGFVRLQQLSEKAREVLEPFALQLIGQAGLDFFNNVILELKWKPKDDITSSDEEAAKKPEKPTPEEVSKMRAIVINFDIESKEWIRLLFIENRDLFFKWMESQDKVKPEDLKSKLEEKGPRLEVLLEKDFEGDLMEFLNGYP